jgi:methyl acetate hydrolase
MIGTHQSRRDMLKTASALMAVSSVVGVAGKRAAADEARLAGGAAGQIDEALRQAVDAKVVPGIVAIGATDKGIVYEGAFGKVDMAKGPDITPDTVFWIASMTKAVTATACMQLVEQGKLQLDQTMGELLPELASPQVLQGFDASGKPKLRPAKRPITLRHLLTHTAGFTYSIWSEPMAQYEKVTGIPFIGTCQVAALSAPLMFDPGDRWEYGIQHRLGRQGRGGGERPIARDLLPREHLRATRHDGYRLPDRLRAKGPRGHDVQSQGR